MIERVIQVKQRTCTECHGERETLARPFMYVNSNGSEYHPFELYLARNRWLGYNFSRVIPDNLKHKYCKCGRCNGEGIEHYIDI